MMTPRQKQQRRQGFSLLEVLLVIAIIAILFAVSLPTYSRAIGKARDVAGTEAMRQENIGRQADNANSVGPDGQIIVSREMARLAYRREVDTGKSTMFVTELVCMVTNEAEFEAYWHTLIRPGATSDLQFAAGARYLLATGPYGDTYELPILHDIDALTDHYGSFPVLWDFLSTNLSEMSTGNIGVKSSTAAATSNTSRTPATSPPSPASPACPTPS
jgi:prepilin-type N-terminal cleavage/methylation domain-containing protein